MAGIHRTHSLKACILIIGPTRITEFGESDAVSIEPSSDLVEMSVSGDGTPSFVSTNDDTHLATLTVRQNSFAYRVLSGLIEAQALALKTTGLIPPVPFSLTNPAVGDQVADVGCVFLNRPAVLANKGVGDVQIRIALGNPKILRGLTITPPAPV